MRNSISLIGAALLGVALFFLPIALSVHLAQQQANQIELERLDALASEILRRSHATRKQADESSIIIKKSGLANCSDSQLELLREQVMRSSYISAFGIVDDTRLICTSWGRLAPSVELGPAEVRKSGARIWINVQLPFLLADTRVNLIEFGGVVAITHRGLVIDMAESIPEMSVTTFGLHPTIITRTQGTLKNKWIDQIGKNSNFVDDDHYVVTKSGNFLAVVAALPKATGDSHAAAALRLYMPFGIFFGVVLASSIYLLVKRQLSIAVQLTNALRRHELSIHYQPVIDLKTNQCVGAEALVRWQRQSDGSWIRPDIFIQVAEENRIIKNVTKEVLKLVAQDFFKIIPDYPWLHIGINLSAQDLEANETPMLIKEFLSDSGVASTNLVIEATERGFLDLGQINPIIQEIRSIGVGVAIDDFGTGYSSLSVIQELPLDYLKIDKSFVDTMRSDSATGNVAEHIIKMAKSLGLKIIAEGVENKYQADLLRELGVEMAQGWYFSKAMPVDDFVLYVKQHLN